MRAIVCGAGRISRELVKRLPEKFEVVLIDKSGERLAEVSPLTPNLIGVLAEDAASPVILDEAGVANCDYVLALTDNDKVNLAIAQHSVERGARHVAVLVYDSGFKDSYAGLGVHMVASSELVAQTLLHYLHDPRIRFMPLSSGPATVFEVNAADHLRVVGMRASYFNGKGRRLVALFRKGDLVFPHHKTTIQSDDRLIIMGEPGIFQPVCNLLDCNNPHFPLGYGSKMLIAASGDKKGATPVFDEGLFLAQHTKVKQITLLSSEGAAMNKGLNPWPQNLLVETVAADTDMRRAVRKQLASGTFGIVVLPTDERSLLGTLFTNTYVGLAHDTETPLLVARYTAPYKRILTPFNGSAASERALEVAVDLSMQLNSTVSVVVVEQPEFIDGKDGRRGGERLHERVRELAHIHKIEFTEYVRKGNPVREIVEVSRAHDLLVVGSTNKGRGLIRPNVGELLARRAHCSTLLVTAS